jgi:hypothetical protein
VPALPYIAPVGAGVGATGTKPRPTNAAFVFGLVTTRQEAAVIAETLMPLEINATPLA